MSNRVWAHELLRQGGKWLGAARSWLQHKQTTKGVRGDMITWGDENAIFALSARAVEEVAAEAAAAVLNEQSDKQELIEQLRLKVKGLEIELSELKMAANAPDDFVIMSRRRFKDLMAAERAKVS